MSSLNPRRLRNSLFGDEVKIILVPMPSNGVYASLGCRNLSSLPNRWVPVILRECPSTPPVGGANKAFSINPLRGAASSAVLVGRASLLRDRLTPLPCAGDSLDALLFDLLARAKSPYFQNSLPELKS